MSQQESPGVGTVLGEAGGCPEIEHGGRAWKLAHPVQRAKALLEEYLATSAVAEVEALEPLVPPATYQRMFRDTLDAIRAKHYRTWGPGWQRAAEGPDGNYLFLFSLLKVHQPDATIDDARDLLAARPLAVLAALARVCPDFFRTLAAALPLPPDQRAEKAADMSARFLSGLTTAYGGS